MENYDFGMVRDTYEANLSSVFEEAMDRPGLYMDEYLSTQFLEADETMITQSIKGGKWILGADGIMTADEKEIISLFDWRNVLSKVRIGSTGKLLLIDDQDGTVLSYGTRTDPGRIHVDELDLMKPAADPMKPAADPIVKGRRISAENISMDDERLTGNRWL